MKQRTTVDDLNQLSPEQKERLIQWHLERRFKVDDHIDIVIIDGQQLPRPNIGQMIELLQGKYIGIEKNYIDIDYIEEELCDHLWEAVKAVL